MLSRTSIGAGDLYGRLRSKVVCTRLMLVTATSPAPVLLRLTLHRRRVRVLELEPVAGSSVPFQHRCLQTSC